MTNEEELKNTIEQLRGGSEVPGLDTDTVIDNYVDAEFKDQLEGLSEEERKKKRDYYINYYKNKGKDFIDNQVATIKSMFANAKNGLSSLQESIVGLTSSAAVPAVITVGSATSSANPSYYVLKAKQAKHTLLTILTSITRWLELLCSAALLIHFVLPNEVTQVISLVAVVTSLINNIPG